MNNYLMLTAATLAAAAGTSTPNAAQSGSAQLALHAGSTCCSDLIDLTWSGNDFADIHIFTQISSTPKGMGIAAKTRGVGRNILVSDSYAGDLEAGYYASFQFGLPVKSGKAFNAHYTTNGTTVVQFLKGYYTVLPPGDAHPRSGPSTHDALIEYISKHR